MVQCPICHTETSLRDINSHIDTHSVVDLTEEEQPQAPDSLFVADADEEEHEEGAPGDTSMDASTSTSTANETKRKVNIMEILSGNRKKQRTSYVPTWMRQQQQHGLHEIASQQAHNEPVLLEQPKDEPVEEKTEHTVEKPAEVSSPALQAKPASSRFDHLPLSERLRPTSLSDYIGQSHLIGPDGVLSGYIRRQIIPSMILQGPPGSGKTSISRLLTKSTKYPFVELSATMHGLSDVKKVFENSTKTFKLTNKPTVLFIDEIHRFNKSQQDSLLGPVEKGTIILIGATTENVSFNINNALISRCKIFNLKKLTDADINQVIRNGVDEINRVRQNNNINPLVLSAESIDQIISRSNGDARLSLSMLELLDSKFLTESPSVAQIEKLLTSTPMYSRKDSHYDCISALHKSIRGSDPQASLYYLTKMIHSGEDPLYIARRLIRIASEDVGLADPSCLPMTIACYQAVKFVGMPEADMALVQAVIQLANAPKSIRIYRAYKQMKELFNQDSRLAHAEIPLHLRNAPTRLMADMGYSKGYKYNGHYKDGKVNQEYLPDEVKSMDVFTDNGGLGVLGGDDMGDLEDPDIRT